MSNARPLPEGSTVSYLTRNEARSLLEEAPMRAVFRIALKNPVPFVADTAYQGQNFADASFHVSRAQAIAAAKYYLTDEMESASGRVPVALFTNRAGIPVYLVG